MIKEKCARYCKRGEPAPRTPLVNKSDLDIVATYGSEYRGLVQFYLPASDVHRLNRLNGVMRASLLKTLACKHHSTGRKMAARYKAKIETPHGLRTCLQVTAERGEGRKPLAARFGGIPLKRQEKAVIVDRIPERVTYPARSCPYGCSGENARSAGRRLTCQCTRSASSPTSGNPARDSPDGQGSWRNGGARHSWPAQNATTPSMPST